MLVQEFKMQQLVELELKAKRGLRHELNFRDPVHLEHWRDGELLAVYDALNDIVNEGKNYLFDVMFNGVAATANNSWFIGLISLTSFTGLAATDVMSSHAGWTEFVSYSESTRVAWGSGTAASQAVSNAVAAQFDVNSGGTVKGVFITTNSTKAGTSGKLWATALFASDVPVNNGDQLKITYTVSA